MEYLLETNKEIVLLLISRLLGNLLLHLLVSGHLLKLGGKNQSEARVKTQKKDY